jgi:hypothetical protein
MLTGVTTGVLSLRVVLVTAAKACMHQEVSHESKSPIDLPLESHKDAL